jgi:hypothetical protein
MVRRFYSDVIRPRTAGNGDSRQLRLFKLRGGVNVDLVDPTLVQCCEFVAP